VYWNCRRLLPGLKLVRYDKNKMSMKPLVNYGKYVLLNHIGAKIIFGADAVIIGMFMQPSAITFYAIPGTLINMLKNLVSSSTRVMSPLFSTLEAYDEMEKAKIVFTNATKLSCIIGLPVGIVFMGKNFISLWMGKSYGEGSGLVLMILTIGTLLTICEHMIDSVLFGMSRHHTIAWLRVIEATAKIVLCIFFIETWGIVGVALGGALAHIVFAGIIIPLVACKSLSQLIFLPFVSSIPFALCCYLLNLYLPAKNLAIFFLWIALIIPIFFVSAWFVVFTKPERKVFIGMVHSHVSIPRLFAKKKSLSI
jgi:O-antigen/teichoic acid export membrane protein